MEVFSSWDWRDLPAAGKSTVAKHLASRLSGHVISMEIYSIEMNHLPLDNERS
jgi:predicted kinase